MNLEQAIKIAEHEFTTRQMAGIAYAPAIIYRDERGDLHLTSQDTERAKYVPACQIVTFVDLPLREVTNV